MTLLCGQLLLSREKWRKLFAQSGGKFELREPLEEASGVPRRGSQLVAPQQLY
jgi:hypothetical protein